MKLKYQEREFDSQFFRRRIADVDWSTDSKGSFSPELVTVKVQSSEVGKIEMLNTQGFQFCEGEISYYKSIESQSLIDTPCNLLNASNLHEVMGLLDGMYTNSRFKKPWFDIHERDRFYQEWLKKALLGEYDDICLAYRVNGEIAGFVTLKFNQVGATIGLIGVLPRFQGKGIGRLLLESAEIATMQQGLYKISVSTQLSNLIAMNLYAKHGYQVSGTAYWFYRDL
ncbi:GNAT family N-acetyltransferase [Vibrio sinaloensis]|uniref:GNAT family N-acetyltransferase n=1 Tax=Photobacterium sp. (strain ATCC 43367) TaxID=379097 RepID=UPI0022B047DE|nr:GNAT family N-acetyltransferase [Vibrio sinaloensis]MCZ4294788.1 GNAT family N-acetyltransferase [Vibrio sinaloensis]